MDVAGGRVLARVASWPERCGIVHRGLTDAIATVFAGASWQRCRTHFNDFP